MNRLDISAAVGLLVVSAVVLIATWPLVYWSDFAPGPAFLPRWIALAGLLLGATLLLSAVRRPSTISPRAAGGPPHRARPLLTLLALVALAALFPVLGLRVAGAAFVLFVLLVVVRRRLMPSLAAAATTMLIVYVVFVRWLGIDIPSSLLGF